MESETTAVTSHTKALECGSGTYGADRLNRKMEMGFELFLGPKSEGRDGLPNSWHLNEVLLEPFTDDELAFLLDGLAETKVKDRWLDESYPERVAELMIWIASLPISADGRCGAAWVAMYFGMEDHGYRIIDGHNRRVRYPAPDFFHGLLLRANPVEALSHFLRSSYRHPEEAKRKCEWSLKERYQLNQKREYERSLLGEMTIRRSIRSHRSSASIKQPTVVRL